MISDEVLAEVRRVREAYANKFNGDIAAMFADLRAEQAREGRRAVSLPPKPAGKGNAPVSAGATPRRDGP